ncbi:kinesin-like protein Klp98A isoform X2 [Hermetia illucens]|uniref:kinesin-like protein Klp98A isoform X2 n=1 Tax=Hermetia illucens TaxID=343691 RepID=UPI0018CC6A87|nr:kinesin-like protein Klp98A isoform X2 [Hermetia illucens]
MSSLKVAVRVRPFNQREMDMDALPIVQMDGKKTRLHKPKLSSVRESGRDNYHDFTFDHSYWSFDANDGHFASQEQVYLDLGTDVVDSAFEGYNACVFAYGQTGSGKTFTMMGSSDNPGLIPRICHELFARMKVGLESGTGYKTHASYLEIYNERVKDLLGPAAVGHGLRVREHRSLGPYVENLSQHAVNDYEEILECINRGNIQRTTASTNMNDTSSRSHAIFTITFVQAGYMNDMPSETVSKIHLVDLAGSERANATGATGQRLKEGAHINKSLVTLGSVISALADQSNRTELTNKRVLYIPYRDSVLTWLLKDSLGGNSKTIMIAAISPADCNYGETLSTLRYANRAKNIINKPTINEDPNVKLIRELRDEINKLKSMLSSEMNLAVPSSKVLEDLLKKEEQEKVLTEKWTEKWKEAQLILQEQKSLGLRKAGVGVVLDSEMPHLIGIHDDISTGVTLYSLKEGETLIGTEDADAPQDIVLSGIGIQPEHCSILLENGTATIYPQPQAQCWLNANLIDEPTAISQGDIILLGRTNLFRFNNPAEAAKLKKDQSRSRLDLSRLSLITASRENLNSSFYGDDELFSTSFRREKQYQPSPLVCRDDPEIQDENRKILETIENALKQLNIERVQMHEQYKIKVQKLTDELERLEKEEHDIEELLNCREQKLLAKKDMLQWEKNNETIQLQIKITESTPLSDDILLQVSDSLDSRSGQVIRDTVKRNREEIKKLEEKILEKGVVLNVSTERIAQLDENLSTLNKQLDELANPELDELRKRKKTLKLNLEKNAQNNSTEQGTSDSNTFHTAASDCSFRSTMLSPPSSSAGPVNSCDNVVPANSSYTKDNLMSDSGVCLDSAKSPLSPVQTSSITETGYKSPGTHADDECTSCSSGELTHNDAFPHQFDKIHKLDQKIATEKAIIMRKLEIEANKSELDEHIAKLQELKKQRIQLEKELQSNDLFYSRGFIGDNSKDEYECGSNSSGSKSTPLNTLSPMTESYLTSTRSSCPSVDGFLDEHFVSIPGFVIRGAGKQTHYEYEVKVCLETEKLTLLRRYSRFRQLHLDMKSCYGSKVALLPFPRREIFSSNNESVAKQRRRLLELYLRRLLAVCSKIPQSPIYSGADGPGITKSSLAKLSNFFQKGLFENGKHGTG